MLSAELGWGLLLWLLFGSRSRGAPQLPAAPGEQGIQTSWPQVVPASLPPFPGAGWQYDEPPPAAVVQRARQLVTELWGRGTGSHRIEQTAGRWIAYRAEVVKSGKKGVVAYRVKSGAANTTLSRAPAPAAPRAPAPRAPAPRAPAAAAPRAPAAAPAAPVSMPELLSTVLAQLATADGVEVINGHTYRWKLEATGFSSVEPIATEMERLGAYDLKITPGDPIRVEFTLQAFRTTRIALNVWTAFVFGGVTYRMRFTDIYEVLPLGQPISYQLPAGTRALPTLSRGMGTKPLPPNENVKLMQRKLGIEPDGQFGGGTETALKTFQAAQVQQRRSGWSADDIDGICGPKTWTALLEVRA